MLQCVAVCCMACLYRRWQVLQCVAVCCSVLQVLQLSYIQRPAGIVWMRCVYVDIFTCMSISFFVCVCVYVWIRCVFERDRPPVINTAPGWDHTDEGCVFIYICICMWVSVPVSVCLCGCGWVRFCFLCVCVCVLAQAH